MTLPRGAILELDAKAFFSAPHLTGSGILPAPAGGNDGYDNDENNNDAAAAASAISDAGHHAPMAYTWRLVRRASGEEAATVYGQVGRFELTSEGTYDLHLSAQPAAAGTGWAAAFSPGAPAAEAAEAAIASPAAGSVRVVPPAAGLAGLLTGVDPWWSFGGRCGPFTAQQYAPAQLSCPFLL